MAGAWIALTNFLLQSTRSGPPCSNRFDNHVASMNAASQSSARYAFWANVVSCILAILGLFAEVASWDWP